MSFIFDLIILVIALTAICHGISKGFVKSGMRLVSVILALVFVFTFTTPLSAWIEEKFVKERVSDFTQQTLDSIVNAGSEDIEIDEVLNDKPEALSNFAERFKFDISDIEDYYNNFLSNLTRPDAIKALSEKIAAPTSASISTVFAAIIIFVATLLICFIAANLLDLLCRLPVLKQLNKILGGLFGVITALLSSWAVANISVGLINAMQTIRPDLFNDSVITGSFILKFFVDNSLILFR